MTKTDPEQTTQRIAALEAALAERDARIESWNLGLPAPKPTER